MKGEVEEMGIAGDLIAQKLIDYNKQNVNFRTVFHLPLAEHV